MSCVSIVLTVRPAKASLWINLLGTEVSLTKTDGPHTIGFSATTYGISPGLFIFQALSSTPNSNHLALRLSEGTSLRAELTVTCAWYQTPLVTSTSVQRLRVRTTTSRTGRGHNMSSGPAVLAVCT
jgi:hypothetical protein